jgi:hypothetical protein
MLSSAPTVLIVTNRSPPPVRRINRASRLLVQWTPSSSMMKRRVTSKPPQVLPRAQRLSALKGCVGTLKDGYVRKLSLPRGCVPVCTPKDGYVRKVPILQAPRIQHASHVTNMTQDTCYLAQVPHISTWSDLTGSLAGLDRRTLLPFSLALM